MHVRSRSIHRTSLAQDTLFGVRRRAYSAPPRRDLRPIDSQLLSALTRTDPERRIVEGIDFLQRATHLSTDTQRLILDYLPPVDRARIAHIYHRWIMPQAREAQLAALAAWCGFLEKPPLEPWTAYLSRQAVLRTRSKTRDGLLMGVIVGQQWGDSAVESNPLDRHLIMASVREWPRSARLIDDALRNDVPFFAQLIASNADVAAYAGDRVLDDATLMLPLVRKLPRAFAACSERLRDDESFARFALKCDPPNIHHLGSTLRMRRDIIEPILEAHPRLLQFVDEALRDAHKDLVLGTVQRCGKALKFAGIWRDDDDVVIAAVIQDGAALAFAGSAQRRNPSIVRIATQGNGCNIDYADDSLRRDEAFALEIAVDGPGVVHHVERELAYSENFLQRAIAVNAECYRHARYQMRDVRSLAVQAVRADIQMLPFVPASLRLQPSFLADVGLTAAGD